MLINAPTPVRRTEFKRHWPIYCGYLIGNCHQALTAASNFRYIVSCYIACLEIGCLNGLTRYMIIGFDYQLKSYI